ncbi:xanthine dehydrogenase family protein molybdopterin-binding subunit [Stappia sp. WLB 29]|uniref:xanthine dehydrogenase family protein molybdopterin-binding subunit n=1 Tax=Stappia sp. WLB 29 TaxID=2925220 RepID=UPI0020BF4C0A|nr:xanthine dehydrogenase family protein molybdopterin-binding subunit [Stappia sp. WLB 29]
MNTQFVGQPIRRVDGRLKVTGGARYAADFNLDEHVYAVIVNATVGLGRIVSIDQAAATRLPGVIAVISHLNAPRLAYHPHKGAIDPATGERLHVLQGDQVRFYGQPVAVVVADTLDQAERAAAALSITYAAKRPAVDPSASDTTEIMAEASKGPKAYYPADTARGDADAALATAPVRIDAFYDTARENHNPMEPHATVARWDGDRVTLWSKTQFVVNEQAEIAAIFGIPTENVQVISPFVGGGFGTTLRTWSHVTIAALAARQVGRPVKLALTRKQMFFTTGHRPRSLQRVALGATPDGKLTSIVHEGRGETSRYEEFIEALTAGTGFMYSCPNVRTQYRIVPLDTGTPNHMRGPGEAQGMFALECAMDELSYELGIDPIELRRRNEPEIDESTGKPFSSRSLMPCYDRGAELFGWAQRNPAPRSMRDDREYVGMGCASATYPVLFSPTRARARLLADGTAEIEVAASDMGPGTYTSMTQVAADALGLPLDNVRFSLGRSDFPPAPPHGGSQTMASVGSAIRAACAAVLEAAARNREVRPIEAEGSAQRDPEVAARFSMHSFGAVFAEVGIDSDVGTIRVRRALGVYGAGRIVNPRLALSQCTGGMVGGIGMALMERTMLDARDGRLVNAHMADYLMPVNLDIDRLEAHFVDEEDPHVNPLGVKGLGEIALVGMAPAIANAIFHATGTRLRNLPISIENVLTA